MDGVIVDSHKLSVEQLRIGKGIIEVTETNSRGISELQEKVDEILKLREAFEEGIDALKLERKLDAMAAKTGCLQFFQECASQF